MASAAAATGVDAGRGSGTRPVEVQKDVPYADQSPLQVLDVYRPATSSGPPAPVIIMVHGGGWRAGDKALFAPASQAAAQRGLVVLNVNYRLGRQAVPAYLRQVSDVRAALAWAQEHAEELGGDPDQIGMVGGSAGGHLAAMVGLTANVVGRPKAVRAVVSLSGPMDIGALVSDLRSTRRDEPCPGADCAAFTTAVEDLRTLLGCDPFECPPAVLEEASPVSHITREAPAFLIANGSDEVVPAAQAKEMVTALRAAGAEVRSVIVPGDEHGLAYAGLVRGDVVDFLAEELAPAKEPRPAPGAARQDSDRPFRTLGVALLAVVIVASGAAMALRAVRR